MVYLSLMNKMSLVFILIECYDGTFGTNCSVTCGHCHKGQSCNKKTGACPKGCDPGYVGIYCNKCKISIDFDRVLFHIDLNEILLTRFFSLLYVNVR